MSQPKEEKIVYPPGVRDLTEEVSTDELYRRLKTCVEVMQTISQEENNSKYRPLAYHLASEFFLEHRSRDIRRAAALCIADIFRIFAPCNPYIDQNNLEPIFLLIIDQLKGLLSDGTNFTDAFYLLENLTVMKTFNLCHDIQRPEEIITPLFKQMFSIVSTVKNIRVRTLTLNMLSPIIAEGDSVPQELLEFILIQITEPNKSNSNITYSLAKELIKQTSTALEPYIQSMFINAMGGQLESIVSDHLYELIYELNFLMPSEMIVIVNNLEPKLHSSCEDERKEVITLLYKLFSSKKSKMIEQNPNLWTSFVSRYKDASANIRQLFVKYCKDLLLNHPITSKPSLIECLMFNIHDSDENVRKQTCQTISETVSKLYDILDPSLWDKFKERALDKNSEIRSTVLTCFGKLYEQWIEKGIPPVLHGADFKLEWIKNKIFYRYYGESVNDKQLVEKLFIKYVVPYSKPNLPRMKLLYLLFCTIDEYALKALAEMIRTRNLIRSHVEKLLGVLNLDIPEVRRRNVVKIISVLSVFLKDPAKGNGITTSFLKHLENNMKLREIFSSITSPTITCNEAIHKYREILEELENEKFLYHTAQVAARILPIIDKECIRILVSFVDNSFQGNCITEAELGLQNSFMKGFELLKMLSMSNYRLFQDLEIYKLFLTYLRAENEEATVPSLQILCNICCNLSTTHPEIYEQLLPILNHFAENGKPMQAKYSVFLLNKIVPESSRAQVFIKLMRALQNHFTLDSQNFKTVLVSSGHIAQNWRHLFPSPEFKDMVTFIVSTVLMHDGDFPRGGTELWGPYENLPDESKVKIQGMKCIVRWLTGKESFVKPAINTLQCFSTYIENRGDLTEQLYNSPMENSWLRLSAACRMLKLCHVPDYAAALSLKQFHVLAYVLNDPCPEVCDIYAKKLNKALSFFKLPHQFLAVFAIGGLSERKEFRSQIKTFLSQNITKRRHKLKEHAPTHEEILTFLPDYALPYAIHLLAHAPFFVDYADIPSLRKIRDCLQMFMECLILKNENYSYSFFKMYLEMLKQTKDRQDPEDEDMNLKLYAVCDLGLNIIMSQKSYVLKEFPAKPVLSRKFFTDPDPNFSNMRTYLPPEFLQEKPVQSCFNIDFADMSKNQSSTSKLQSSMIDSTLDEQDSQRSDSENLENISHEDKPTVGRRRKKTSLSKSSTDSKIEPVKPKKAKTVRKQAARNLKNNNLTTNALVRKRGRPPKNGPKSPNKNPIVKKAKAASRSQPILADEESLSDSLTSQSSGISVNISDSDSIKRLIRECNVCLNTNEVEQYTKTISHKVNNIASVKQKRGRPQKNSNRSSLKNISPNKNILTNNVLQKRTTKVTQKQEASDEKEPSPIKNKKARETSPSIRSLRSNAATSPVESTPETTSTSSCTSDTKTNSSLHTVQSITSSIIKYAPKRASAASVIVQNSQNNLQQKLNTQSSQSEESVEQNNTQRNKKPVTRSNKIKSSPKTVNTVVKRLPTRKATLRNKVAKEKSKPTRR